MYIRELWALGNFLSIISLQLNIMQEDRIIVQFRNLVCASVVNHKSGLGNAGHDEIALK